MAELYAVDANNDRLKKHDPDDWAFISKYGSAGTGDTNFEVPTGICSDDTYIYVSDFSNYRIKKHLRSDFSFVDEVGSYGTGDGQFQAPYGLTTDGTHIWICDSSRGAVKKHLCSDLSHVTTYYTPDGPYDITTDGTYLYILDSGGTDRLRKYNISDFSFVSGTGTTGSGDNQFSSALGITTDGAFLWIADSGNDRVKKHKCSDLSYVAQYATDMNKPWGVTVDGTYVYTAVQFDHKLVKLNASAMTFVSEMDNGDGSADNQVSGPRGIESDGWYALIFEKTLYEFSLDAIHALNGLEIKEFSLDQLHGLTAVTLIESELNQLHGLTAVTLIESELNQLHGLTSVTLIEASLDQLHALGVSLAEFTLDQLHNQAANPVPTSDMVDIYYQLYVGTELVPFSSLRGSKRNKGQDSVYLVIPNGRAWIDAVTAQAGQDLVIKRGGRLRSDLSDVAPAEFIRATFEDSSYDEGSRSSSMTLLGYRDIDPPGPPKGVEVHDVSYLAPGMDGKRRVRCRMDDTLNYGDQLSLPDATFFTVGEISYTIAKANFQMEAKEK